ncbi:MerR family transcriptional regulator [Xenophilus sp. Marseille-Q4582]|uniref:MerR family transcriptional regulator n=1 Tax=Xenophilus sp. Marseille-Q4582 TaxID=2866600 RepID=UPI001CE44792|nr:MerR family transcriptional regulator [Xenophilus sp. Marseille-Q4582]
MEKPPETGLPPIPVKRYFTIGEVAELCGVKPHVLRYWEQEFTQLRPMKRRGNRRYYQHHEVLMIRRIRDLLYDQGFTISGARNRLQEMAQLERERRKAGGRDGEAVEPSLAELDDELPAEERAGDGAPAGGMTGWPSSSHAHSPLELRDLVQLRQELQEIRAILSESF